MIDFCPLDGVCGTASCLIDFCCFDGVGREAFGDSVGLAAGVLLAAAGLEGSDGVETVCLVFSSFLGVGFGSRKSTSWLPPFLVVADLEFCLESDGSALGTKGADFRDSFGTDGLGMSKREISAGSIFISFLVVSMICDFFGPGLFLVVRI